MRALVDGDILLYRCAAAAQHKLYVCYDKDTRIHFGEYHTAKEVKEFIEGKEGLTYDWYINAEPSSNAIHNFQTSLEALLRDSGADEYVIYLSADVCFRDKISTTRKYKGNRDHTQRPVHYKRLKKYVMSTYDPVVQDLMEADDLLGIAQCSSKDTMICSLDKDLDQIPGLHYNWVKGVKYLVTPEDARRNFWVQVIAGDATDNIQGIPGIGIKTAEKLLAKCTDDEEYWSVVIDAYNDLYGSAKGEETAIEMARLVYILKEPLIGENYWTPPS